MRRAFALIMSFMMACSTAYAVTKEDIEYTEGLKRTAIKLFNEGEYKKAIPLLDEIISINPEDKTAARYLLIFRRQVIEPYCKQAAAAYMAGDYPEAVAQWEKILKIDPDDRRVMALIDETFSVSDEEIIESMFAISGNLLKEGRYEEASAELEKILRADPDNKQAIEMMASVRRTIMDSTIKELYDKAAMFLEQKEYTLAKDQWNKILAIDSTQDLAARMVASIQKAMLDDLYSGAREFYIKGDYISSRDYYNRILTDNPTDQSIKTIIGKLNQVINVVPQVKDEGKVWDVVRKGLSHYISAEGNPRVAVSAMWYAVQLEPQNTLIMAIRDFMERENVSVIRSIDNPAQDMNVIEQNLFASLNHIYEGRYDLAIQECSLALELEPDNVMAMKRMGSAYFAMGRKEKAKEAWNRALALDPGDKELKQFINQAK